MSIPTITRGGAVVAGVAHNHEVAGANPAPATRFYYATINYMPVPEIPVYSNGKLNYEDSLDPANRELQKLAGYFPNITPELKDALGELSRPEAQQLEEALIQGLKRTAAYKNSPKD